jgi:hypothetical protein
VLLLVSFFFEGEAKTYPFFHSKESHLQKDRKEDKREKKDENLQEKMHPKAFSKRKKKEKKNKYETDR